MKVWPLAGVILVAGCGDGSGHYFPITNERGVVVEVFDTRTGDVYRPVNLSVDLYNNPPKTKAVRTQIGPGGVR